MSYSMTGFARQTVQLSAGLATFEIKTVNHRHLECVARLGHGLEPLEGSVRERVTQRLARGRVDVSIRLDCERGQEAIPIDDTQLEAVAGAIAQVRAQVIDCNAPDALSLLNYPGVIERTTVDADAIQGEILAALDCVLDDVLERRQAEGSRLVATVRRRLDELKAHARSIRERVPVLEQMVRERLQRRLDSIDVATDPARLEQEVALAVQRMDIAEELDRVDSHCQSIDETLATGGAIGRRLDFWLQELVREVNTIGSKTQDSVATAHTVDVKVLLEQMREQVQNIE